MVERHLLTCCHRSQKSLYVFTKRWDVSEYPNFGYSHSNTRQFRKFSIDLVHWRQYPNFVSRWDYWIFSGDLMTTSESTRTLRFGYWCQCTKSIQNSGIDVNAPNRFKIFGYWQNSGIGVYFITTRNLSIPEWWILSHLWSALVNGSIVTKTLVYRVCPQWDDA